MINDLWRQHLLSSGKEQLLRMLENADDTHNFEPLEQMLKHSIESDPLFSQDSRSLYRQMLAHASASKIIPALKRALLIGESPTIEISKDDGEKAARELGRSIPKSPQDFLYTFISERASEWIPTLELMGFTSAVMTGEQVMTLMSSPRLLDLANSTPDQTITELSSAMSNEFRETMAVLSDQPYVNVIRSLAHEEQFQDLGLTSPYETNKIPALLEFLRSAWNSQESLRTKAQIRLAIDEIERTVMSKTDNGERHRAFKRFVKKHASLQPNQEQLALKFLDQGRYLQKILGGAQVEEISSNLKMQPNRMRGNKVEVDRIYRVNGQKKVVLVEAKGGPKVSRGQLYQLYETFAIRLPREWDIDIAAVLMDYRSLQNDGISQPRLSHIIDIAIVDFNDSYFGDPPNATLTMSTRSHFRWVVPDE